MQTDELKMNLKHQFKRIFEMYEVQSNISNLSFKRVNNAETIWKLGQEKYDLGLINVFNLNDIKLAYEQAMLNYFDKSFDVLKSHYDLLRITGNISQEYKN